MADQRSSKTKGHKLQTSVEDYTRFVVTQLIGIKGRSDSDVTAFILKDWIGDHQEELARSGIDVATWQKRGKENG